MTTAGQNRIANPGRIQDFRPVQLDFDLRGGPRRPAPREEPTILTVAALTRRVRDLLEKGLGEVWVEGEISNLRRQASGHVYFTLKDASSQLACVLFASQAAAQRGAPLRDGAQVQVSGQVTVYEARGQYQLIVRLVQEHGIGALQAKFEELKCRLAAEGLFETERKRPLPRFPQRIAVVTSPTGAAIRDFLHVLHRRQPGIEVVIAPVRVQGRGAAAEIARAIGECAERKIFGAVDVIVVTRGGGSLEDLWEFNEEAVARAVADSPIPVVSAIGHEIDFTICDFAAALRAPTPSAAAEILSADAVDLLQKLTTDATRLRRCVFQRVQTVREMLEATRRTALFLEPHRALRDRRQTLDRGLDDLTRGIRSVEEKRRQTLAAAAEQLRSRSPENRIARTLADLRVATEKIAAACQRQIADSRARVEKVRAVLEALSPVAALDRGYTLTTKPDGTLVRTASALNKGDEIVTRFRDGRIHSVVESPTSAPNDP